MSYIAELYRIAIDTTIYTWTNGNAPVVHNLETYTPIPIGRSADEQNIDVSKANISVRVPVDNPLVQYYLSNVSDFVATVTIFRKDTSEVVATYWKGRVTGFKVSRSEGTFECESVFTSLRKTGLRAKYQRSCRFALYHRGCGLDPENFRLDSAVVSLSGNTITTNNANSETDGWFTGGMIRGPDGSYRWVINHVGNVITLQRPYESLIDSLVNAGYGLNYGNYYGGNVGIALYPGCDRTLATCLNKFNNVLAQGGFRWIPEKNPFDGSLYGGGGGSSPVQSSLQKFRMSVRRTS